MHRRRPARSQRRGCRLRRRRCSRPGRRRPRRRSAPGRAADRGQPGAVLIALGQPAIDRDLGPERGIARPARCRRRGCRRSPGRRAAGPPARPGARSANRSPVAGTRSSRAAGALQVAHRQQTLGARAEHAAGLGQAFDRRAGHQQAAGERAQRRVLGRDRQVAEQRQDQLAVAAGPQALVEAALGRTGEADGIDAGRRQALDAESPWAASASPSDARTASGRRLGRAAGVSVVRGPGNSWIGPPCAAAGGGCEQRAMRRPAPRCDAAVAGPSVAGASSATRASARQRIVRDDPFDTRGRRRDFPGQQKHGPPQHHDQHHHQQNPTDRGHRSQRYIHRIRAKRLPRARIAALYRVHEPVSTPGRTSRTASRFGALDGRCHRPRASARSGHRSHDRAGRHDGRRQDGGRAAAGDAPWAGRSPMPTGRSRPPPAPPSPTSSRRSARPRSAPGSAR